MPWNEATTISGSNGSEARCDLIEFASASI